MGEARCARSELNESSPRARLSRARSALRRPSASHAAGSHECACLQRRRGASCDSSRRMSEGDRRAWTHLCMRRLLPRPALVAGLARRREHPCPN
eukprot:7380723-Prymnesium_polylepis.1